MKRLLFFLTCNTVCLFSFSSFSQSETSVLSNGVVVHQSVGVEGKVLTSTETPVQVNSIDNWNIEQCEEVINYIKIKSAEGCSKKESEAYLEQLKMLEERVIVLKTIKSN